MVGKKIPKIKAEAKVIAKVEASVKASYQRKKTVTEVVPEDVTRAKASAWLDLVSPITEWAGLKGDQIRSRRDLLRIQREDALTEIVVRAREKLEKTVEPIRPIPNKFIVPFLEKASLEEVESELVEAWANLLTAAATKYDPHMVRFCTILFEIGPNEVTFLHRLCREARSGKTLNFLEDVPMYFASNAVANQIDRTIDVSFSAEDNIDLVIESVDMPGGLLLVFGTMTEEILKRFMI